jgi:RHS repeat-associated protein
MVIRRQPKRLGRPYSRHIVEALERRTLLVGYNFNWVGGPGDWSDATHWTSDAPANVTRPRPTSEDFVRIGASAGTVTAGNPQFGTATIDADLRLVPAASAFCWGGRLTMNGTLTFVGGGQFVTRLVFVAATSTLDGIGTIAFESGGGQLGPQGTPGQLTIGAGITIRPGGTFTGNITSFATTNVTGGLLTFDGTRLVNRGVVNLTAGELRISSQTWTNLGTINIAGGRLSLGGTYRQSDLGNYVRTGGTVVLSGTLLGDLTHDDRTGSWETSAVLKDGRFTTTGSARLLGGLTLDNYTIASDFAPTGGISLRNDLILDNANLALNGVGIRFDTAPRTNVRGNGRIDFSGGSLSQFVANQTLTIDAGIEMRTVNGGASIGGNNATQRIVINGPFTVTAQNQTLDINTRNVDFNGALTVASGSNLFLASSQTFTLGAGASMRLGERTRLDIRGTFVNAAAPGNVRVGGTTTIIGGTAAAPTTIEAASEDRGPVPAGYRNNASMGVLRLNGAQTTKLLDAVDNAPGSGADALYIDSLVLPNGAIFDVGGLNVYARAVQANGGTVVNGSVALIPDGGPIDWALPTSGRIAAAGEKDEWTFTGAAGQTVSAVLNPSANATSSSPAALAPQINLARLALISPSGVELASVQTVGQGAFNTLAGVTLPTTGTYKLRVQAPLNDVNRTGLYNLTLYDTTVQTRPLTLNTVTPGSIETPFSSDKWTFSLSAGQQVQFDLIAAQTRGLQFTLEGPEGYVAFSNLTDDSTLITVPPGKAGNYALTVRGQTDQTGAYSIIVRDGSITPLTLGAPFSDTLPGSGAPRWFKLTLPNPGQLLLTLDDLTNSDRNQLYLRRGALPTRDTFDHRSSAYAADAQIYVPNATPGDWYVLLYGDYVPAPSAYTLEAEYSDLRITSITPDRYATDHTMTMTVTGGGFEPGSLVKLVSGATTLSAATIDVDSFTQITATFNLAGVPQGKFAVRVERGPLSYTLPQAFTTLADAPAHLDMKLVMPGWPTRVSARTFRIEYGNSGNVAMPAPLIIVQSGDPQGDEHPILTLDLDRMLETFWGSQLPPDTSERIMMLGSGAVPGVLNPGEHMSINAAFLGDKVPFETTDLTLELEMLCVEADGTHAAVAAEFDGQGPPAQPFVYDSPRADMPAATAAVNTDWAGLKDALQPPSVPDPIWDNVYDRITAPLDSVESYIDMLIDNAVYLGRLGQRVVDVDELWNFEVRQSLGTITAFPTLASSVDAQVPAPGEPLTFARTFPDGVISRNTDGPFGFGWAVSWVTRLSTSANGNLATLHGSGGGERLFVRDSRGSTPLSPSATYISGPGDPSTLRRVSAGIYELRDVGGTVTRFRADGRIDYVEDANANRTTAGYNGSGRLVSLTHNSGGSVALEYNASGRVSKLTDSLGHVVTYGYDPAGDHLVSASGTDGSSVQYDYDTTSPNVMLRHALRSEQAAGSTQLYTYDAQGRVASSSLLGGVQRVDVAYDTGSITLTDAAGSGRLYFDHRLRLAKVTNALGASSVMRYDADDHLASVTLPDGSTQHYTWCDCGSLMTFTNELGNTVTYTRAATTHELTSVRDPKGNVSHLTYDDRGNQLALVYADGSAETAGNYTASGLPQAFTTRAGQASTYAYNAAGQITRRTAPDGTITDFTYDSRGRLATTKQGTQVTTLGYDTAVDGDRLERVTYPDGRFLEYDYDDAGRRVAVRDQSGYATRYDYDSAGRLAHVRDGAGAALATYAYDPAGRLERVDNGNGTFTTYAYDAAGQVLRVENWRSAGVLNSAFRYTYDTRGRRTTAATPEGTWNYGYDPAGQLTSATLTSTSPSVPNQDIQITYDAAGNRTFARVNGVLHDYASNALNQYTRVDGVDYTYDANGNLLSDGTRQYAYDDLNRLLQITAGADTQQFEYNVFGGRDATVVNGQRSEFLLAPGPVGQVLAEYDGSGALLAHNLYAGYLVGRTSGAGAVNYYDTDLTGSVAGLTDGTGAYADRYAYDPFGQTLFSAESVANPYEFVGTYGVRAAAGGFSEMGFRAYSAAQGRFTSAEPLRTGGDVNAYRNAANSPTMKVDPLGLWGEGVFAKVLTEGVGDFNFFGGIVYGVGNDAWISVASGSAFDSSVSDALWSEATSFTFGAGFSLPGLNGVANGFQVAMNPEVNQHFVSAACGLAYQREFGTINKGAAKQLAALAAEEGGAGGGTVNAACLDGFPGSADADLRIGDRCGFGQVSLAPRPLDPNDKIAPVGVGPENLVPIDKPVQYTIDFENLGPGSRDDAGNPYPVVATVPAQRVSVSDQLSGSFDWSTVRFDEFRFGDTIVPVEDGHGAGSFHVVVPLQQNGVAYQVRIDTDIDVATGILSVILQALDPETGLPPAPMIGVLAPEDGGGHGMGYFKFSVRARPDVPDGTQVRNVALIRFDQNEVIATNQVNPLDASAGTDPAREALVTLWNGRALVVGRQILGCPGKSALLPGQTATLSNITNSSRGVNGIAVDVAGLPEADPAAGDFLVELSPNGIAWHAGPAAMVSVERGGGAYNTDRVILTMPDGAAKNTWVRLTVKAGLGTGLASPDVFYIGNLAGDTGNDTGTPLVNVRDLARLRANFGKTGTAALERYDFNRDGKIDARDLLVARSNEHNALPLFQVPAIEPASVAATTSVRRPTRRGDFRPAGAGLLT